MRFVRTAIQITSTIFTNCLSWVRQNLQQSQIICHSKNSVTSQSKQHDIHFISVYRMKHVISHIHSVFMYWMKHVISQLSEHSCAVWYHSQFDIIHSLILCAVWYCLHSLILFFLFNLNCASTSLYILRLEHALLILYFLHYIVIKNDDIFQKKHLLQIWCCHDI